MLSPSDWRNKSLVGLNVTSVRLLLRQWAWFVLQFCSHFVTCCKEVYDPVLLDKGWDAMSLAFNEASLKLHLAAEYSPLGSSEMMVNPRVEASHDVAGFQNMMYPENRVSVPFFVPKQLNRHDNQL